MSSISKRQFLKLMLLPCAQALSACLYHNQEDLFPDPVILQKNSAILNDFNGMTLIGEDEISIEWINLNAFPMTLEFSSDNGANWQTLHTLLDDSPYLWTIPQLSTNTALLRLVNGQGETETAVFNIIPSVVLLLASYPQLENAGSHQVLSTSPYGELVIRNIGGTFIALSLICTHAGCTAQYGPEIYCSCHGSRFTIDGEVINGPAARPLERLGCKHLSAQGKLLIYDTF